MNNVNPLLDYARKPEFSIKLPSNGGWYPAEVVELNALGEVDVLPMLPKDELTIANPDALLSGQANIDIIASCVPAIKHPEMLFNPDVNVLLLAIKAATYGDELKLDLQCPNCLKIKNDLEAESKEEEIKQLEKEGKICLHPQTFSYSCLDLLNKITLLDLSYVLQTENGLKIYYGPNRIKEQNRFNQLSFKEQQLLKHFDNYNFDDDATTQEEKERFVQTISDTYARISEIGNQIIADAILKVDLPDGTYVTDKKMFYEFISQSPATFVNDLFTKIRDLNSIGLPTEIEYECPCCGHKWKSPFFGYNQADFFGISS